MSFERVRGEVSWHGVDTRLRSESTIWVVTAGDRGPHAAAVWFVWDGDRIVFATPSGSHKARDLRADPRIELRLGSGSEVVQLSGAAILDPDDVPDALETEYGEKYVEPFTGEHAMFAVAGDLVVAVPIRRITAWVYGDLRTRTVWRPQSSDVSTRAIPSQ